MFVCDSHTHFGQFNNLYNSEQRLYRFMRELDIDYAATSSTTTCVDSMKALKEMRSVVKHGKGKIVPVLWVTGWMLESGFIEEYLKCGIEWKCLKVHGLLESETWQPKAEAMNNLLDLAKTLKVPVLFHTGDFDCCRADVYEDVIRDNPDINFILAHGVPILKTSQILKECENAYMDTAFTPIEDIEYLVEIGLSKQILWGSDCLVNRFFKHSDCKFTLQYYKERLRDLHKFTTQSQRADILRNNFLRIFNM